MNYQKIVHFLKEFNIFPEKDKDKKKLYQLYLKYSTNMRDLEFDGFLKVI